MAGEVRQNFHSDCEKAINSQIALELEAMYKYLSMASYFERHNVALPGFAQYFHKAAHEELQHVEMLAKYQSKRGGQVTFQDIKKPAKDEWGTGLEAMESALEMEKEGNVALIALRNMADDHKDYDFANFLDENFLEEHVQTIKEMGDHVSNLRRVGKNHGEYHFDLNLK